MISRRVGAKRSCAIACAPSPQVFVSYGPKTSGALLLSYGFLPGGNAHDGVALRFGLPRGDPAYRAKLLCLERHGWQV